jgi:hypothetical protein
MYSNFSVEMEFAVDVKTTVRTDVDKLYQEKRCSMHIRWMHSRNHFLVFSVGAKLPSTPALVFEGIRP